MTTEAAEAIEVRCPSGPGTLLAILRQSGEKPRQVEGNLLEIACSDCARLMRRNGVRVFRVLHRYNFIGECVETVKQYE